MIQIKPTPTNNLSLQHYIVNEFDPIIIKEDEMYLDCRLKIDIFLDMKTIKGNNFKCVYVDNEKKNYDWGALFNMNGCVKRKMNKLSEIHSQQYICPSMQQNTHFTHENIPKYHCYKANIQKPAIEMYSIEHKLTKTHN
jgi:hypothetical protein